MSVEQKFVFAGAELDWPLAISAGLSNHPSIEGVASQYEYYCASGVSVALLGSWTVGDERSGNGYQKINNHWEYLGGDEYVDLKNLAGYNAKGLPGPGTNLGMPRLKDFVDLARSKNIEPGLSLSPHGGEPLEELKEIISLARTALKAGMLYVEVNLSCPNVEGRPAFYLDPESLFDFYEYLYTQNDLQNKYDKPGVYLKYGPYENPESSAPMSYLPALLGGVVTSNTLGNQIPINDEGEEMIKVNGGKAGKSGPALKLLGRQQTALWAGPNSPKRRQQELVSVLGVGSGQEVKKRLDLRASLVQMGSILYWPELVGCDSAGAVIDKVKKEFVDSY